MIDIVVNTIGLDYYNLTFETQTKTMYVRFRLVDIDSESMLLLSAIIIIILNWYTCRATWSNCFCNELQYMQLHEHTGMHIQINMWVIANHQYRWQQLSLYFTGYNERKRSSVNLEIENYREYSNILYYTRTCKIQ